MVEKGDLNKIVQSQNVTLLNGADDWVLIYEQKKEVTHPETRRVVRKGVKYAHEPPDRAIIFKILASTDVLAELRTKNTMNSRRVLPSFAWSFRMTPDDGSAADTVTLNGVLRDMTDSAPENGYAEVECFIRITDQVI